MSIGRSGSLPSEKTAPARTRATCSGSVNFASAGLGGVDNLVGHRQPGSTTTNARTRRWGGHPPVEYRWPPTDSPREESSCRPSQTDHSSCHSTTSPRNQCHEIAQLAHMSFPRAADREKSFPGAQRRQRGHRFCRSVACVRCRAASVARAAQRFTC